MTHAERMERYHKAMHYVVAAAEVAVLCNPNAAAMELLKGAMDKFVAARRSLTDDNGSN